MADDQPAAPGGNHNDPPGQQPTGPLNGSAQPLQSPPTFATAGPPREALAGFWRRLGAAFLDWVLVGIVAAAIGQLFGVKASSPASAHNGGNFQAAPGPFVLVALVYFTWFLGTPQADLARHRRQQPGRQRQRLPTGRVRPPRPPAGVAGGDG